jgi:hypothetical protein
MVQETTGNNLPCGPLIIILKYIPFILKGLAKNDMKFNTMEFGQASQVILISKCLKII